MPNILVSVEEDQPVPSNNRIILWRCDRTEKVPGQDGMYRHCTKDSSWLVTQIGEMTGRQFTLHLCNDHAKPFLEALKKGQP